MERHTRRSVGADGPPLLLRSSALYLDFDGTLVGLAPRPDLVAVTPALQMLLHRLRVLLGGAVAIVSGRSLRDLDLLLRPALFPGAGLHGAELRFPDGCQAEPAAGPNTTTVVQSLRARFGKDPRLLIEDKGAAVALHFRQAPEKVAECLAAARELAAAAGLDVVIGKKVVELRPPGADKGLALRMLSRCPPFQARTPVFVGDDATDEDGFAAATALGGYGVKVGLGQTQARYFCRDVDEVCAWLRASLVEERRHGS